MSIYHHQQTSRRRHSAVAAAGGLLLVATATATSVATAAPGSSSAPLPARANMYAGMPAGAVGSQVVDAAASSTAAVPLKDAKLNIEHNATDEDTGFQGFIDSEGWRKLDVRGPGGRVLTLRAPRDVRRAGADRAVLRVCRARQR